MQFMTALFGGPENPMLNSAFALGLVLVMIVLGLWALKAFTRAGNTIGRGRNPRLSVVDTAMVDGKRQVVIIRRDNVEHLIMTGGPQDLVIESGIQVADQRPSPRRTAAKPDATHPGDIETPITPDRPVSREAVDRLRDLARPAPLRPGPSLRGTALLRPVGRATPVIPMDPERHVDNSAGASPDSAKPGLDGTDGQTRVDGRRRFFRRGIGAERL